MKKPPVIFVNVNQDLHMKIRQGMSLIRILVGILYHDFFEVHKRLC